MILLFLVQAAVAQPPARDTAVRDYMHCIRKTAIRLEPSGDSPQDIGKAATAFCMKAEEPLFRAHPNDASTLRETAIYYGAAQAVAARLCRKTKDCELNSVP